MQARAVFDCMVFLQAVTSKRGPSFQCLTLAEQGRVTAFLTSRILNEIQDVLSRPILQAKFPILTPERVQMYVDKLRSFCVVAPDPPKAFTLPRDAKDEPYTDLAIAVNANYLVTWNERHLTYLMKRDTPEGQAFCRQFPTLTILSPADFLKKLREEGPRSEPA